MNYYLGILLDRGSPIFVESEDRSQIHGIAEQLKHKNASVDLVIRGTTVSFNTRDVRKTVQGEGDIRDCVL